MVHDVRLYHFRQHLDCLECGSSCDILNIFSAEEMKELLKDLQVFNPEQRKRLENLNMTRQNTDSTSITALSDNMQVEQLVVIAF